MNRYITCADTLKTLKHLLYETAMNQSDLDIIEIYEDIAKNRLEKWIDLIPTADVPEIKAEKLTDSEQRIFLSAMGKEEKLCKNFEEKEKFTRMLDEVPTADVVEVKHGKWTEKEVIHKDEAEEIVEEWQSCRCSICGHYNTQPYMYYFREPNYCSYCGVSMKEE